MQALRGLVRTMRPKQWTKNVLFVFPAIIFDGKIFQAGPLLSVTLACVLVSLIAGTVYIINDLVDIESDRQHPRKQHRPLPSGQLPVRVAIIAALVIPIIVFTISVAFNWKLAVVLAAYFILQLFYSFFLKHIVIIDVLAVTGGFVLRVVAGVVVIEVTNFSPWLYVCAALLALFLAVSKRRQELILLGENAGNIRDIFREYNLPLLDDMLRTVMTSTLITYTLYTINQPVPTQLAGATPSLITVPFVMYGLFRYLYLIHVKEETSPPDEVLLKDRPLQVDILLFALTWVFLIYVIYGPPETYQLLSTR